jgi:hypothetical protein
MCLIMLGAEKMLKSLLILKRSLWRKVQTMWIRDEEDRAVEWIERLSVA